MTDQHIPLEPVEKQRCSISISSAEVSIYWHPALPEEAHKPSRIEIMAAGALLGIARALMGKGEDEILAAIRRTAGRRK